MRLNLERNMIKILRVKNAQYEPEAVHNTFLLTNCLNIQT